MPYVADFSFTKPSPASLRDAGYVGGIGYCSYDPRKNLTLSEIQEYRKAGLQIGLVWETTNQRASLGYQAGVNDGNAFLWQARVLGASGGTLWVVAEDPTREPISDYANIDSYFQGLSILLRHAGFQVGAYGSEVYVSHAAQAGLIDRRWYVGGWSQNVSPDLTQQSSSPSRSTLGGTVDCNYSPSAQWGWTEFNGESDMTPEQDQRLTDLENKVTELYRSWFEAVDNTGPSNLDGAGVPWAINQILQVVRTAAPGTGTISEFDKADIVQRVLVALTKMHLSS